MWRKNYLFGLIAAVAIALGGCGGDEVAGAGGAGTGNNGGGGSLSSLSGKYCYYHQSATGGYSGLDWAYFDGEGRFTYGGESSFSGDSGSGYGSGAEGGGSYTLNGNTIVIKYDDGSGGNATVNGIDNGEVTSFYADEKLYSKAMCNT